MPRDSDTPELDERRIRQAAYQRRALLRARFFMGLSSIACIAGSVDALQYFLGGIIAHQKWMFPSLDLLAAIVLFVTGLTLARHARMVHHALKQPKQQPPAKPPDFTGLSDGSQHARKLDEMK